MKNSFLKIVLPALAIMLAVGLSFASSRLIISQTGYYDDPFIPGIQQVITDCTPEGTLDQCTENGYPLYDEPALATPLKRVAP